jgi:hypothetical protein
MFRFTIRDVLWLMVTVGLSLGWWINHRRANELESDNSSLREALDSAGFRPGDNFLGRIISYERAKPK